MNNNLFSTSINQHALHRNSWRTVNQPLLESKKTALLNEESTEGDVNRVLINSLMNKLFYGSNEFLERPERATSQQFLEQVTYKVDLSKLYKIEDTCLIHQKMPYCPILVQNMQKDC